VDLYLLRLGQTTAQTLNGIHREGRRVFSVLRVKMWSMVLATSFDEHPDDDPKEAREFRALSYLSIARMWA
jgi:hypothetical protein